MNEQRVLVFPPGRRDGEVTRELLERGGPACYVCNDPSTLATQIDAGGGALVLTDAALVTHGMDEVLAVLARQPPWSDLPVVLLIQAGTQSVVAARVAHSLTNVTILDRPTSARTLLSAVQTAIRGRLRQYQIREQLEALRAVEEELRMRERQLHTADRRKDEFLAMLAHELRNPLAPIRNASELLARTATEPRVKSAINVVKRQVTHLARLVDDLLDVSRITQGRIELQRAAVELSSVIAEAMESVEPLVREKRHRVLLAAGNGPLYVSGDSARLVQCIANVLINSAKYTDPDGEIRIDVCELHATAFVTITDNGIGIPEDLLPQIFEPFVQSHRSLDRAQGGLGIGLSIVRRLIEMHGGKVSAFSRGIGQGTRFEIRLPLIEPPHSCEGVPATRSIPPRRMLIVDDNADAAESLALLLRLEGHGVEAVYSGSLALERATNSQHDVILLDIGLPGMDGYEVARRIRASGCTARIVALTGYGQSDDIERGRDAGFDSHLVKPVDLRTLRESLN